MNIPILRTSRDIELEYGNAFFRFVVCAMLVVAAMGLTVAFAIMLYLCSVYDIKGEGRDLVLFCFILFSGCLGGFSVATLVLFVHLEVLDRMVKIAKAREVILGSK